MKPKILLAAVALSLAVSGCTRAQDTGFDKRVHDYIVKHPEVIEEAVQALRAKQETEAEAEYTKAMARTKAALPRFRQALERDPRDFVANPNGKITVTEFFDYRCPHCKNAAAAVLGIAKANPDVRVVFKEMPIFGAVSEHAARVAIAAKARGDYLGLYTALMAADGLDDAAIDKLAGEHGVSAEAVDEKAANQQIKDVHKLAESLGVTGTPTFIIGDEVVPGEDTDAVNAAIAAARKAS